MRALLMPPPGGAALAARKLRAPTRSVRRGGAPPTLRVHASQRPAPQSGLMRGMRLLAGALASAQAREATPLPPPAEEEAPPHRKERSPELRFRTVFISDIHLVRRSAHAYLFARPKFIPSRRVLLRCARRWRAGDALRAYPRAHLCPQLTARTLRCRRARRGARLARCSRFCVT